jgi:hypothetical protein
MPAMNLVLGLAIVVGASALAVLLLALVRRRVAGPLLLEPTRGTPMIDHPYKEHTGSIEPTEMRQSLAMTSAQISGPRLPCRPDGRSL